MKKKALLITLFVVVALAIASVCMISLGKKHVLRDNIAHKIDTLIAQEKECVFELSEVTEFQWDKVVHFESPASASQISEALGAPYTGGTDLMEGFIFAYRGKVVHKDVVGMDPERVDKLAFQGDAAYGLAHIIALTKDEAVFEGRRLSGGKDDCFYIIQLHSQRK